MKTRVPRGRWIWAVAAALLLGLSVTSRAIAQGQAGTAGAPYGGVDSRWLPWLGCWQLVEQVGDVDDWRPADPDADPSSWNQPESGGTAAAYSADRVFACLMPSDIGSGVDLTTLAEGQAFVEKTIYADGSQHPIEETACRGWQLNQWSQDSFRLFTLSEAVCQEKGRRLVSGISLMTDASTWLDIQLVDAGGDERLVVRRYYRVSDRITADAGLPQLPADVRARVAAAAEVANRIRLSVDDVIEASRKVEPEVVEAALVETEASFDLDGRTLLELDDAGVDPGVIDLMVALSFPEEFIINRGLPGLWSSSGSGVFVGGYESYGYGDLYPYYASPFGYYYSSYPYGAWYYPGPARTYFLRGNGPGGRSPGRVIQSRGFTQVRARDTSPDGRRTAVARGSGGTRGESGGGSSGGSRAGGSGGSGSGSSGGSRTGGSGGSGRSGGGRVTRGGYTRSGRPPRE